MNRKEERLSEMILSYLRRHPSAGDTLEGITKWWLELEKIEISVDEVASVLERLTEKRLVKKQEVKGGSPLYKITTKPTSSFSKKGGYDDSH